MAYDPLADQLQEYSKDWRRLRRQKTRRTGGVEARVLTNLAMVFGEHYIQQRHNMLSSRMSNEDRNKLFLVFNMLGRAVWRKMGRLWSIDHGFRATPNTLDPAAFDNADVVSDLIRALNRKVGEKSQHWVRLFWLLVGGVVIEHTPWVESLGDESLPVMDPETNELLWEDRQNPGVTLTEEAVEHAIQLGASAARFRPIEQVQTVGDVGSQIFSPLNFFIDSSCLRIKDLAPDQACYFAEIKTHGWIRDNFGSDAVARMSSKQDLNIVSTRLLQGGGPTVADLNLQDLIPAIQGVREEDDPEMAIILTRYTPRSEEYPSGMRCIFVPDDVILDEVELSELGYESIPANDIHWRPPATSFWTPDFVTDMRPGQKFLNKRMSQLGEAANAQIYETLLLGQGLTNKDLPADFPGVVENGIDDKGMPKVLALQRGQLPGWFVESIKLVVEFVDAIGGADLLTQRKFPGQLRGPLAIPMLQEILDSEDGPLYSHLGETLADIHQMRVNRVKVWYPPVRTLHYTGQDRKDEVLVFHTEKVLRSGYDYQITVDQSTLLPELSSLREARVRERLESPLAGLYINPRTGKMDFSKVASDLKYSDRQREERAEQYRKLARQLISHLNAGEQLDPALPMTFWDHDAMMDELEAAMSTTEWLNADAQVKQNFATYYEKHRAILQQQHEAQQQAMQGAMMHGAIAQATQQAAAKAASVATEQAIEQVHAQENVNPSPIDAMRDQMAAQKGQMPSPQRPVADPMRRG